MERGGGSIAWPTCGEQVTLTSRLHQGYDLSQADLFSSSIFFQVMTFRWFTSCVDVERMWE